MTRAAIAALIAALVPACQRAAGDARMLDGFEDLAAWRATASDGVTSAVEPARGVHGGALRLAFDFAGTSGYAVARRALALDLSGDFELSFELRGELPVNHFELKLIDDTGDNVWWFHRRNHEFPTRWRRVVVKRSQIEFAWGPITDRTLRKIAAIELVVSTGRGGGRGWIEIDDLAYRPRPVSAGPPPPARATASSSAAGAAPALAVDGDPATAWASDPAAGAAQTFTLDLGRERDFGGLLVRWGHGFATDYTVELSGDGSAWQRAASVAGGNGGIDPFVLPESTARFLRLQLTRSAAAGYQLAELGVLDGDAAASPNAVVASLARLLPRGSFPRGMSGEQVYWTVVGVDGGAHNSLLSEDGALELRGTAAPGASTGPSPGPSIEPFVEVAGRVTSWATVGAIEPTLEDGYLPIPSVTWRDPAWELRVTAVALGDATAARLAARYTLRNRTDEPLVARLVLAVRPFQVNPPSQMLNLAGGVARVEQLAWTDGVLAIAGAPALRPLVPPDRVSAWPFHASGYPIAPLAATPPSVTDPAGLASAALAYDLSLAPRGEATVVVVAPLIGPPNAELASAGAPPAAWFDAALAAARATWHDKLDRVGFRVPASGRAIVDSLRSSLAYMLLSRDGPILRPGTRSYARAWIRDGAMIGQALLRLGHPEVATAFLRWYAPYQFASGKVPCCVEANGAVPVPENDSHGQLIFLVAEIYRHTRDRELLTALWPRVVAAARYLEQLRQSERTPANQTPERRALHGLLPPSISHEGYSAKPAYSYWDDFWGLTGYKDAAWLATELGDATAAAQLAAQRDEFRSDLLASIAASAAIHRVPYIPGAADLGDFDATSTTIALSPADELAALPADLVTATFERAWQTLLERARTATGDPASNAAGATGNTAGAATADTAGAATAAWTAYTPYELRLIGSFARLGWRDRVQHALALYLADRRPAAWNQWAEVVGRVAREPRFLGDMPHAWVHSDYARSVLDLFAHERGRDRAWLLAAGIAPAWFLDGFAIERLPTPFGPLSYAVSATDRAITVRIDPGAMPPGGLVFLWPWPATPPGPTRIDGAPARWTDGELAIPHRPATIVITRSAERP